jgi:AcrR family transcriptional regulator
VKTRARGPKSAEAPGLDEELTDTQRRILTAALEVFAEKGFAGASTAEIAGRAGVAEKTIFAHYGSKQALLVKTLTPSTFSLVEPEAFSNLATALAPGRSLRELLGAFIRDRVRLVSRHPERVKLVLQEALLKPEVRSALRQAFVERVGPLLLPAFMDLQKRGELRDDLPLKTILRTIASTTIGFGLARYVLDADDSDPEEEIDNIVELLVAGLEGTRKKKR